MLSSTYQKSSLLMLGTVSRPWKCEMFTRQASYNIKTKVFVLSLYLYIFDGLIHRSQVISELTGLWLWHKIRVLNKQLTSHIGLGGFESRYDAYAHATMHPWMMENALKMGIRDWSEAEPWICLRSGFQAAAGVQIFSVMPGVKRGSWVYHPKIWTMKSSKIPSNSDPVWFRFRGLYRCINSWM